MLKYLKKNNLQQKFIILSNTKNKSYLYLNFYYLFFTKFYFYDYIFDYY